MEWTNLVAIKPEGDGIPLFCVQGDEANRTLPIYLGEHTPFYAFQHQGGDGKRIELDRVEIIAAHFLQELKEARPAGPYLLCGYSFGGILAYEMAQQLIAAGEEVPLLTLFDSYSPVLHEEAMQHGARFYEPLKATVMRKAIESRLRRGSLLKGRLRHFHIIDTYDKAVTAYTPKPFNGKLSVFKAKGSWGRMDMGWHGLAQGGFEIELVPGDHYTMITEPNVAHIAQLLKTRIQAIEEAHMDRVP
jgi:aspartate racemase